MSEKKLSAGEKRLKNILESLADIVAIFDRQGNLRFVTPSVKRLLGYEVSAITGANGFDFIHEEDRSRVMASFSSALEMGQHEETFRFRQADGAYLWFEGVGSAMEGDGNAPGLIVACRNVTRRKGMEDELRASETRYRVLSSIIPDFAYSCTHGAGGGFVLDWATEGFEKVTEWRLADLLHKECWFMLCAHPEDIPVVTRQMKNLELNKINTEEFRICTKSGRVLWIRNNLQLVADEHAAAGLRLYGAVQDITEQKVAYEALYNSELKYRDIFNAVTDGILMMPLDGSHLTLNQSFARMHGYRSPQEMEHLTLKDIDTPASAKLIPERLRRLFAGDTSDFEVEHYHRDGSVFSLNVSNHVFDIDGRKYYVGFHQDLSELKRVQKEADENRQMYKSILMTAMEGYWMVDMNGCLLDVNDAYCRMSGYSRDELLSMCISDLEASETLSATSVHMQKILEKGKDRFESRHRRKDGSILDIEISVIYMPLDGGRTVSFMHDITERKMIEAERQRIYQDLKKALGATVQAIATVVESRDPYTAGHQRRVADLARAIAVEMNLPKDRLEGIYMASRIHDIGKISVPSELLSMPRALTDVEFNLIMIHSQSGYDILKNIDFSWPIAQIVLQHHERLDGSGYPNNLKGSEILLEAQVIGVADVVESMASHRPYRPGLGIDVAMREIEKNKGKLYNADAVDACLRLFRERGYKIIT